MKKSHHSGGEWTFMFDFNFFNIFEASKLDRICFCDSCGRSRWTDKRKSEEKTFRTERTCHDPAEVERSLSQELRFINQRKFNFKLAPITDPGMIASIRRVT